jgi:hypothetical protein
MDEQTIDVKPEVKKEVGEKNARFMAIIFAVILIGGVCVLILLALNREQPNEETTNPTGSEIDTLGTNDRLVPGMENIQFKAPVITKPNSQKLPSVPSQASIQSATPTQKVPVTLTPTPIPTNSPTQTETPTSTPSDSPTETVTPTP